MYASVSLNDYPMILMAGPGKQVYTFTEGVSLDVDCDGQAAVDYYWNHPTADGG